MAPDAYRRRRLGEVGRILPVLGAVFFIAPTFWAVGATMPTARVFVYIFVAWFVLILGAALLSRGLRPELDGSEETD